MGAQLACRQCDGCTARYARDRCHSMCFGTQDDGMDSLAHAVGAFDEDAGREHPEKYDVCADTGYVGGVCHPNSKWCPADACAGVQKAPPSYPGAQEHGALDSCGTVMPAAAAAMVIGAAPASSSQDSTGRPETLNVGPRRTMAALEEEFRFNAGKVKKIRKLGENGYGFWRPIRGDGNCYYRTVIFGALEAIFAAGDFARMRQLVCTLRDVHFENPTERRVHAEMVCRLQRLQLEEDRNLLEQWIAQDEAFDQALIRACRRLVRLFLIGNADQPSPNGLTYAEMVCALDSTYSSMEAFCESVVDPMGRDAETLALDALPLQLGIGLRLWLLDRRDEVELLSLDTLGPDGRVDVHALFKPGHYDLLYLNKPSGAAGECLWRPLAKEPSSW